MSTRNKLGPVLLLAVAATVGWLVFSSGGGSNYKSFQSAELPPLDANGTWLNTDGPLSWEQLRGKVVWLEFSFLH